MSVLNKKGETGKRENNLNYIFESPKIRDEKYLRNMRERFS